MKMKFKGQFLSLPEPPTKGTRWNLPEIALNFPALRAKRNGAFSPSTLAPTTRPISLPLLLREQIGGHSEWRMDPEAPAGAPNSKECFSAGPHLKRCGLLKRQSKLMFHHLWSWRVLVCDRLRAREFIFCCSVSRRPASLRIGAPGLS